MLMCRININIIISNLVTRSWRNGAASARSSNVSISSAMPSGNNQQWQRSARRTKASYQRNSRARGISGGVMAYSSSGGMASRGGMARIVVNLQQY